MSGSLSDPQGVSGHCRAEIISQSAGKHTVPLKSDHSLLMITTPLTQLQNSHGETLKIKYK
jgi:hypothetical protein